MDDEKNDELVPKKQSLFPLTPEDIVDNALQNLDEKQARQVSQKAADEIVNIAIEKRRAEYRGNSAREEMRNVVENANLLDQRGGDYKINSTFETTSGTTNVEIQRSKQNSGLLKNPALVVGIGVGILVAVLLLFLVLK